jgi:hypothetical protein
MSALPAQLSAAFPLLFQNASHVKPPCISGKTMIALPLLSVPEYGSRENRLLFVAAEAGSRTIKVWTSTLQSDA